MVKSPIKVIESGNVPTTENLGKGQVAFGQVGDSVKLYGSDGTTVTELGGGGTEVNNIAPLTVTTPPTSATETGIAIGNSAKSAVTNAIAIGTAAGSGSTSSNSVSIGTQARGVGVAIGTSAAANASDSVAIGGWSSTNGLEFNQVALGTYSKSTEANTVSVGSGSSVATLSDDMTEEEQAIARAAADVPTRRIVNVTDPRDAQDAATKNYVDTTLDQSVQRDTAISASESTVNIGVTKGNIGDKSSTTSQVALPVASATSAGVLNASTFQAIQNNAELVDSILDGTVSLDNLPSNPSQEDLTNAWKTATERDLVINGATIDDQVNAKTWRYYTNIAEWRGNDAVTPQVTVNQWSNTSAGIVKGSTTAGQIFAEADGTGSVNGWDDHESRITNNTTNITSLQTNVGTLTTTVNSKADQDDLEALQTTVAGKADSSALANYATKQELASKADASALANYATKSELEAKADTSDLADYATKTELAAKADQTAVDTLTTTVNGKANQSDLTTLQTTVTQQAETITQLQATITQLQSTIDSLTLKTEEIL